MAGGLDIATAPQLEQTSRHADVRPTRGPRSVDLAFMGLMPCAHLIVDTSIRPKQAGGRLILVRGPPQAHIFALTRTAEILEIVNLKP